VRSPFAFLLVAGALVVALAGCGGGASHATTASSGPVEITITIEGGKPVGGITKATVQRGQNVSLVVRSDVADEVHLHGYDLHTEVKAGGTAGIDFTASIAGVFVAELEHRKLQILELTVR
jgi:hypothetical protein